MIRINLLPVRAAKKRETGQRQIVLFVLVLVGALIGNYYWYAQVAGVEERERSEVARIEKEIADLDRIIGEVKNYEKENKALEEKLKVLDQLKRGRTGPVKMLDALATSIPKNVWLKKLEEKSGAMTIDGAALSNDDLAEFMKALGFVVWTPEGMGRLVETGRKGDSTRVELTPSGQIKDILVDQIGSFFKDIRLKKAELKPVAAGSESKLVEFQLTLNANFAI
ncbi:MAG: PilN domain-containing protein [Deltaproteobacteria bacterium]|nr:PilN domain-containing protein [Deltaproteobacteria bacterium]